MTPKEKAIELYKNYEKHFPEQYKTYQTHLKCIECALIAVNELIYEVYSISHQYTAIYDITTSSYLYNDSKELTFWKEVKEEIKNL